ncbi:MAG: hypothetical protein ABSA01_07775 [Anaerolineales bacterium]|jgi:hypothetical protein
MKLVEQHIIDRQDPRFSVIDPACFASKNLYNAALYILRQRFFDHERIPTYAKLNQMLKDTTEFRALPVKVTCRGDDNVLLEQNSRKRGNSHSYFPADR